MKPPACNFTAPAIPIRAKVFAAGGQQGRPLDFQIDQSGELATVVDVIVNSSSPVVLMVAAHQPSIWNISWTQRTKIVAVLASGHHRQDVVGLPSSVPVLVSTFDNANGCGYIDQIGARDLPKANSMVQSIFGRSIEAAFALKDGRVTVGDAIQTADQILNSKEKTVESLRDPGRTLIGLAALNEAVLNGYLRKALPTDIEMLKAALDQEKKTKSSGTKMVGFSDADNRMFMMFRNNAYVVLKSYTYPVGLNAGVNFIIPKGVPTPLGKGGEQVYDLNKFPICQGVFCR